MAIAYFPRHTLGNPWRGTKPLARLAKNDGVGIPYTFMRMPPLASRDFIELTIGTVRALSFH